MKKSLILASVSAILALLPGFGGASNAATTATSYIYTVAGNSTWTCPPGVSSVQVECWGGGGGGGGVGANYAAAGGGAGGSYVKYTLPVSAGTTYNLTVGAGGAGGAGGAAGSGTTGTTGSSSFFGSASPGDVTTASVLAVGGAGGLLNNTAGTSSSHYTSSIGGTGSNTGDLPASGASANIAGTSGATAGSGSTKLSGAGGARAGPSGSAGGGAGGAGLTSAGNGTSGNSPGGGGSGGLQATSTGNGTGGNGGAGQVTITVAAPFAFTPGNLAVLQPDNAGTNSTTFSILEVQTNVANQVGAYVVHVDGSDSNALIISGSAGSAGYLATSGDGTLLAFVGANSTNIGTAVNGITNRGVGTLNMAGNYALQTTYTNPNAVASSSQPRGASTSDNVHWVIGDQAGIYTNGSSAAAPAGTFFTSVKTFGGTVYVGGTNPVVMTYSGGTTNPLPGLPADASATDFYLISSGANGNTYDVLYYIDNTSATAGTIYKYYFSGGVWNAAGSYNTGLGGWSLCAATNGDGTVNIYFTTGKGATIANSIIEVTDSAGWNSPIPNYLTQTILYTAPAGDTLKGIAFVPVAAAPTVLTATATSVGTTSATLEGSVSYDGGEPLTAYGFYWGTGSPITTSSNLVQVGTSDYSGSYAHTLTGLGVNTEYFYRAYANNATGNTLGSSDVSFWTLANTPTAPTVVGGVSTTSLTVAIGSGDGNPAATLYAIKETTSGDFVQPGGTLGSTAAFQTAGAWGTETVTGLNPSTTYTFEAEAQNGAGTNTLFGPSANGTTATPASPTITVTPNILSFSPTLTNTTSANLTYTVSGTNLTGNIVVTAPGNFQVSTSSGTGFGSTLTLTPTGNHVNSTTIYVHFQPTAQTVYAGNITDVSSGADNPSVSVSGIGATAPSVSTQAANPTNVVSATLNGTVTATNGAAILDSGFYWSTLPNVNTTSGTQLSTGGTTPGAFSAVLSGLSANTEYFYRAYASNSVGFTLGGADVSFYTLAATPSAPIVGGPTTTSLSVAIGTGDGNSVGTSYAIEETNSGDFVQSDGSLAATPVVFQTASQWGSTTVGGLAPGTEYAFTVEATNGAGIPTAFGPVTTAYTANVPFTQGNIAVLSADEASANNTAFSILEVNGSSGGLVQTVPINGTSGSSALRVSGSAGTAPKLANSDDGSYLVLAGFNSTNSSVTANTITNRAVATLDADAAFVLRTTYVGISGNQVRSATTVDDNTWYVADGGGIYTNNDIAPVTSSNIVSIKSFGGVIYALQSAKGTVPLSTVSADGTTLTPLPSADMGLTARDSSAVDFCLAISGNNGPATYDLLYVLDEASVTAGTITKYYLDYGPGSGNTGDWIKSGSFDTSTVGSGLGGYSLAAYDTDVASGGAGNGGLVNLYLTTGDGTVANNSVWLLSDAAGSVMSAQISAGASPLFTATGGSTLKGVALVPNPVLVTSVGFSPATTYLAVGNTTNLAAEVQILPANATTQALSWHSDNISVATVSSAGLVTAEASGTAHIYVTTTDGSNLSATNLVNVVSVIQPLSISGLKITGSGATALASFSFTNAPGLTFSVLSTNNLTAPLSTWPVIGHVTDSPLYSGHYLVTDTNPAISSPRFYILRQP